MKAENVPEVCPKTATPPPYISNNIIKKPAILSRALLRVNAPFSQFGKGVQGK